MGDRLNWLWIVVIVSLGINGVVLLVSAIEEYIN